MLINQSAVKEHLLTVARDTRAHRFERVSAETLEWLEGVLREKIEALVRGHPGAGKTIYPPVRRKEAQP